MSNSLKKLKRKKTDKKLKSSPRANAVQNMLERAIRLHQNRRLSEAKVLYDRILTIDPENDQALNLLGLAYLNLGKLFFAISPLEKAIKFNPRNVNAYANLGEVFRQLRDAEKALSLFEKAISLNPNFIDTYKNLFHLAMEKGDFEEAERINEKIFSLNPHDIDGLKNRVFLKKFTKVTPEVILMENLLKNKSLPISHQLPLAFSLGKVFDDLGDYQKAFNYFSEANKKHRGTYKYSIDEDKNFFASIKKTFSSEFFSSFKLSDIDDSTPCFVLGMPRSGTSLVEQILASHPSVFGAGELSTLGIVGMETYSKATRKLFPEGLIDFKKEHFEEIGEKYLQEIKRYDQDAKYIINKLPGHFMDIGYIKSILPKTKIINCTRNSTSNCFSIFKHPLSQTYRYASDLTEIGQYYNLYNELMGHWEKVLPGFIYTIKYENLVLDTENQIRSLLDFLELPFEESCLEHYKTKRSISTFSNMQARMPIYNSGMTYWKNYEQFLGPLKQTLE